MGHFSFLPLGGEIRPGQFTSTNRRGSCFRGVYHGVLMASWITFYLPNGSRNCRRISVRSRCHLIWSNRDIGSWKSRAVWGIECKPGRKITANVPIRFPRQLASIDISHIDFFCNWYFINCYFVALFFTYDLHNTTKKKWIVSADILKVNVQ